MARKGKFSAVFLLSVSAAVAVETNVWKGASSGGLWDDQDNWTLTLTPTVNTVYDFTALQDGAVVTNAYKFTKNTAEQLKIGGLIFGRNRGRVKLFGASGSETIFDTGTILVPGGTTLDVSLIHTTGPWKDQGKTITLDGDGDVDFSGDSFRGTIWTYNIKGRDKTVRIGSLTAFTVCYFQFADGPLATNVTLKLTSDTCVGGVKGPWFSSVNNWVDIGTYALTVDSGYGGDNFASFTTYEAITGTGPLTFEGGSLFTLRAAPRSTGGFTLRNADVELGRSYNYVSDPTTSTAGATKLPVGTRLNVENSGILTAFCDQSLSVLTGEGTCGTINLSTNWAGTVANLAVTGSGVAETNTYNARIAGLGGLVKSGAASTLVLTGDNTYTGATTVAEGTLMLSRPVTEPEDTDIRFDFSRNDWTNANYGALVAKAFAVTRIEDGVPGYGPGAIRFSAGASTESEDRPRFQLPHDNLKSMISSNDPFTVSLWIRPGEGIRGKPKRITYLTFNGSSSWLTRQMARIYLYGETNLNFSVGQYESGSTSSTNGVSANIPQDSLYDGRWHQVVMTYGEGNMLSGYYDGSCLGSVEIEGGMQTVTNAIKNMLGTDVSDSGKYYDGDMDEWKILDRAMTASEVLADFRRATPVVETADALPAPVWHGTYGSSYTTPYVLTGESFPENLPTGRSPFTVSCRYNPRLNSQISVLVSWGDTSAAKGYFLVGTDTYERRRPMFGYSVASTSTAKATDAFTNMTHCTSGSSAAWTHVVCTYDGSTVRAYQDGHLACAPKTGVTLDIKPLNLCVGKMPSGDSPFVGKLDDIQIFDVAMTPEQVRSFSRGLKNAGGREGPVLPETAVVSVAAGARFGIAGTAQKLKSLSGAGMLELGEGGETMLDATDSFTGTLSGRGRLNVADRDLALAGGSGFSGTIVVTNARLTVAGGLGNAYVSLREGASLDNAGAAEVVYGAGAILDLDTANPSTPAIVSTGRVALDANLKIRMSSRNAKGNYTLVSAGTLALPQSFDGWTLCDQDGNAFPPGLYTMRFVRQDGVLNLGINAAGVTIIFR